MIRPTYNESPSLTELYGDDMAVDIIDASRESGVSPLALRDLIDENPELLGYILEGDEFGAKFAKIINDITGTASSIAPGVGQLIDSFKQRRGGSPARTPAGLPAVQVRAGIDPQMFIIPAVGIAALLLIMAVRKKKK
jgi:hypothetical protein